MSLPNNLCENKVSIIVPVYNVKQYLAEALESVINQTYKNLEIIVVDDGSDDGSEKICDEYAQKDRRIKLFHINNRGLSVARNLGLDNMTGDYVAFLDSDDVFLPETIEKSLSVMLSNNVDIVIFNYTHHNTIKNKNKLLQKGIIKSILPGIYSRNEVLNAIVDGKIYAFAWNKLYKREIWNNLRFPEGFVYEDVFVILQIICKTEKIYIMNDVLILYRKRSNSITSTKSAKNLKDFFEAMSAFESFVVIHTPKIFDKDQLQRTRKVLLNNLVLCYAKFLSLNLPKSSKDLTIIREKILTLEKIINIKKCNIEIRFLYYFIFNYPELVSMYFSQFLIIYKNIRKVILYFKQN